MARHGWARISSAPPRGAPHGGRAASCPSARDRCGLGSRTSGRDPRRWSSRRARPGRLSTFMEATCGLSTIGRRASCDSPRFRDATLTRVSRTSCAGADPDGDRWSPWKASPPGRRPHSPSSPRTVSPRNRPPGAGRSRHPSTRSWPSRRNTSTPQQRRARYPLFGGVMAQSLVLRSVVRRSAAAARAQPAAALPPLASVIAG